MSLREWPALDIDAKIRTVVSVILLYQTLLEVREVASIGVAVLNHELVNAL